MILHYSQSQHWVDDTSYIMSHDVINYNNEVECSESI